MLGLLDRVEAQGLLWGSACVTSRGTITRAQTGFSAVLEQVLGGDQDEGDQSLGEKRERDAVRIVSALVKEAMGGVTRADTYGNITIKRVSFQR